MKKLISGFAVAVAIAARNEVFTLVMLVAFALALVAALVNSCGGRAKDVWAVDWE